MPHIWDSALKSILHIPFKNSYIQLVTYRLLVLYSSKVLWKFNRNTGGIQKFVTIINAFLMQFCNRKDPRNRSQLPSGTIFKRIASRAVANSEFLFNDRHQSGSQFLPGKIYKRKHPTPEFSQPVKFKLNCFMLRLRSMSDFSKL